MDSESDSAESRTPPRKVGKLVKKRYTSKNFQDKWTTDFPWVMKIENDATRAKCKLCDKVIGAGKSELAKHQATIIHEKDQKAFSHQKTIDAYYTKQLKQSDEDIFKNNVKCVELKLALYFVEHNVAIQSVDHLIDLLKVIAPDSKIIQEMNLKQSKCTEIITNVLCEVQVQNIVKHLQQNKFSIMVDESTDISTNKNLSVVKYQGSESIETRLLELVQLNTANCTAQILYTAFLLENIIAMASNGCNTMTGAHNFFYTQLKSDVPDVFLIPCIYHSSAIIASKACEQMPRSVKKLLQGTYNYVSGSSKRCKRLVELQEFFKVEQNKILNVSATRWLSRHHCVVRYLENYEVLKHYFRIAVVEDKLKSAEHILAELNNICNKAYLYFMKFTLNFFNTFNGLFQSRDIKVHVLYDRCNQLLKQMCQNFMKLEIVLEKDLASINVEDPSCFLPLEKI